MAMAFYLVIYFIDWPFIFAPYSIPGCVLAAKAHFLQRRGQKIWAERRKKGIKSMVIQSNPGTTQNEETRTEIEYIT
jgi:hypothetical protein